MCAHFMIQYVPRITMIEDYALDFAKDLVRQLMSYLNRLLSPATAATILCLSGFESKGDTTWTAWNRIKLGSEGDNHVTNSYIFCCNYNRRSRGALYPP